MDTDLFHWTERLHGATTTEQIQAVCADFARNLGMDYFSFTLCTLQSLVTPKITVIHNYPKAWEKEYRENEYFTIDPVFTYSTLFDTPIKWSDILRQGLVNRPESTALIAKASKYGICDGLAIPTYTANGTLGIFCLATGLQGDAAEAVIRPALSRAQPLSIYICDAVKRCLPQNNGAGLSGERLKPEFTRREKECLLWASEGKTAWEIAKILGISERTVQFHLNNCARKFGAINRQQAVAKAIMLGVIKPTIAFDKDTLRS